MDKQLKTKITWVIKDFSTLQFVKVHSDQFVADGCKWRLSVFPKGNNTEFLFLFLEVVDHKSLPRGWRRHTRYVLSIVNQNSAKRSKHNEEHKWFCEKSPSWSHLSMFPLNEIHAKNSGFLVNGELTVVAEVEVLEIIGPLDVTKETSTMMETMNQLYTSQVGFVNRIFEKHPEIASEFRSKNPNLRTGYMTMLRGLIETLRQSPNELSKVDLSEASAALQSMTKAGFKLNWLEKKLDEVWEKKDKEEVVKTRMQKLNQELNDLKQKCSLLKAQLKKEALELSVANAPISFDDVI